jgi:hypothetical protein
MSAGTLLRIWLVYSGPPGSLAYSDFVSRFEMWEGGSTDSSPRTDIHLASAAVARVAWQNQVKSDDRPE